MEQVLEEIKTIRRYVGIGVTAICIAVLFQVTSALFALRFVRPYKQLMARAESNVHPSDILRSKATERLMAGDFNEVLKLTEEHEKKYPNDPYIFYYRGLAYQGLNDPKQSLDNLEKAQDLAPTWKESYTGPEIKKARKALGLPD